MLVNDSFLIFWLAFIRSFIILECDCRSLVLCHIYAFLLSQAHERENEREREAWKNNDHLQQPWNLSLAVQSKCEFDQKRRRRRRRRWEPCRAVRANSMLCATFHLDIKEVFAELWLFVSLPLSPLSLTNTRTLLSLSYYHSHMPILSLTHAQTLAHLHCKLPSARPATDSYSDRSQNKNLQELCKK